VRHVAGFATYARINFHMCVARELEKEHECCSSRMHEHGVQGPHSHCRRAHGRNPLPPTSLDVTSTTLQSLGAWERA
jgi:hypothetical protein